jgi:hypothetical protein
MPIAGTTVSLSQMGDVFRDWSYEQLREKRKRKKQEQEEVANLKGSSYMDRPDAVKLYNPYSVTK